MRFAMIAFVSLPLFACLDFGFDGDSLNWACQGTGQDYDADVGGCEIGKECGWNRGFGVSKEYEDFVGTVICVGEEGGTQDCSCVEGGADGAVVHTFEYAAACDRERDWDFINELMDLCGWQHGPEDHPPEEPLADGSEQ